MPRKENKKPDAIVVLASILTLPDKAQITICQKWIVPPEEDEEYKREDLVAISEFEKVDWRQTMIDYLCYNIQNIRKERPKSVVVPLASFTANTFCIEDRLREFYCVV